MVRRKRRILATAAAIYQLAYLIAVIGGAPMSRAQEMATKGIFQGHGIVKAISPGTGALTLSHDDIKGFMPAMEMMYRVRTPELSKDLHPGDVIDFKIDAAKYVIVDVKLAAHAK